MAQVFEDSLKNGAESLVRTLVGGGVNVCFANPDTSEMHFIAALDRVEGMRCVLGTVRRGGHRCRRRRKGEDFAAKATYRLRSERTAAIVLPPPRGRRHRDWGRGGSCRMSAALRARS